ncbi:MAG: transglutaminase-like domain-containing protein [Planctomycetaceae bacterium]|nr:transglutaminase-like domain-containing protein [Planctomycetaceae bacterium]
MFMRISFIWVFFLYLIFSGSIVSAQFKFVEETDDQKPESGVQKTSSDSTFGPKRGAKQEQTWVAGVVIEPGVHLENVKISMPVPADWYEQEVVAFRKVKWIDSLSGSSGISGGAGFNTRVVNNGAKELTIRIGNLRLNKRLEILFEFDTVNYELSPPDDTDIYFIPKKIPDTLTQYIKASPKIEIDDSAVSSKLRKILREITNDRQTDWEKVEAIYRYVQRTVKYSEVGRSSPAKGTKAILAMPPEKCEGDCKDLCGLFVALCRMKKIPARLVRLPEHCYAEFYLELRNDNKPQTTKNTNNENQPNSTPETDKNKTANNTTTTPKPTTPKPIPPKNKSAIKKPQGFWFPCQVAGTYSFGGIPERQVILQKGDSYPDPEAQPYGKKQFLTEVFEGSLIQGSPNPNFKFIHNVKTK